MAETASKQSYCVDLKWQGRANCKSCVIRNMMLFSQLPSNSFDNLLQPVQHEQYGAGSVLYHQGQSGAEVFSIRRGLVKLVLLGADGNERIVRLLGRGAVIGLELLDKDVPYRHSAITLQEVDLCRIPLPTLTDLYRQHPELCKSVGLQLQHQVDQTDRWIMQLNTGKARTRIAEMLLFLEETNADQNGAIELLSRDDMAAVVGITKETASRIIAEFKRQGLLYQATTSTYQVEAPRLRELIMQEVKER